MVLVLSLLSSTSLDDLIPLESRYSTTAIVDRLVQLSHAIGGSRVVLNCLQIQRENCLLLWLGSGAHILRDVIQHNTLVLSLILERTSPFLDLIHVFLT